MERRKFEDSFKDAFQDAQVSPSESVWTSIELDLERAEGSKMKRRILFYKMLAAASVVFGMSVAGVGYYVSQNHSPAAIATVPGSTQADVAQAKVNTKTDAGNPVEGTEISAIDSRSSENNTTPSTANPSLAINSRSASAAGKDFAKTYSVNNNSTPDVRPEKEGSRQTPNSQMEGLASNRVIPQTSIASLNSNSTADASVTKLPTRIKPEIHPVDKVKPEVDPIQLLLADAARREKELADEEDHKKDEKINERLWTSVGVAAGAFSSTNSSVSPAVSAFNATADQQVKASGVSYSMGVSVGARLSNRWVLQGGLNYQTQSSDYTANSVVGTSDFQNFYASSMNTAARDEDTKVLNSAPYSVNNNLQFVNVPLQAGYLVINKKIGVQLNAGISTDLFLQNTITPESGSLEKSTQGAGDSSPYRTVNFSGLVGTELTYKFGEHYRLALNPGLRYPMNSIYKSSTGVEAAPLTFDVGLRFRYIFNQ